MLIFYLAALAVLFVSAFWSIDSFTGKLTHVWTWTNFDTIIHDATYRQIAFSTIWMAAARHPHRCGARVSVRVLHGPSRKAAPAHDALRARPASAVVELPRANLRVAAHPRRKTAPSTGRSRRSACPRSQLGVHEHGDVDRLLLHLAPVHDPADLRGARADPGLVTSKPRAISAVENWTTFRCVILPLALPGLVAGSIFTFSLTLGDYITPTLVGGASRRSSATSSTTRPRCCGRSPVCCGLRFGATHRHGDLPSAGKTGRRIRGALMERELTKTGLRIWTWLVVLFLHAADRDHHRSTRSTPETCQGWPITDWTPSGLAPQSTTSEMQQRAALVPEGRQPGPRSSPSSSARRPLSQYTDSGSSAGRQSRSCSFCPSRSQGSSPGWR